MPTGQAPLEQSGFRGGELEGPVGVGERIGKRGSE